MDIVETRRENLRRWVAKNGTPEKEKSLFSQLKATGSFGEKVARRLEKQYRMGDGYLDAHGAQVSAPEKANTGGVLADSLKLTIETAAELRLLTVYRLANEHGKGAIDDVVDIVQSRLDQIGHERKA